MLNLKQKRKFFTLILIIFDCKQILGLRREIKIDSKTDKWKSDCASERIKNGCFCSDMHIFGCLTNNFQSPSHNEV